MYRPRILLLLAGLLLVSVLNSLQVPFYLDWRSSNGYFYYDFSDYDTSRLSEFYKVRAGIDTLFTNGVRTRLALTNQEERLSSQVVFEHAIIDYQAGNLALQLAMKDFGYGNGFWLNNRRNDNPLYERNALLDYRWHGLGAAYRFGKSTLGAGIGGNELNRFIYAANYNLQAEGVDLTLFGVYAHKDDIYTTLIYHCGYEASLYIGRVSFRSGLCYNYLPEAKHYPEMDSWHWLNEMHLGIVSDLNFTISTDHQTPLDGKRIDHIYEACLDTRYNKLQANLGLRNQNLPGKEAYIGFLDLNLFVQDHLKVGLFGDYVNVASGDDYLKFGFQTSYHLK
jgi:hypothetical protein